MAEKPKHNYGESKIKTLNSLKHIWLRTGMYIGRIGNGNHYDDGCYNPAQAGRLKGFVVIEWPRVLSFDHDSDTGNRGI